jgi:hypothetical protein
MKIEDANHEKVAPLGILSRYIMPTMLDTWRTGGNPCQICYFIQLCTDWLAKADARYAIDMQGVMSIILKVW